MKLKFKIQAYQTAAVQAVVDCFKGQAPRHGGESYRVQAPVQGSLALAPASAPIPDREAAFGNAALTLSEHGLLDNIQQAQRLRNLPVSSSLAKSAVCPVNLDVEMETGTGKTYCYIKTIFELNKQYGWSKFIIVVPSIAIREGVASSLESTAGHFLESYGKKARFFVYDSKDLHELESFSSDAGINVMVINVQAFNGRDTRRIYDPLDDFQSRRPIDVISANRPILILDEPQKMEGGKTLDGLAAFQPLMVLRYSATHKTTHNKVYRLDALDAYKQKLVKKISVRGITMKGQAGTSAYLYLQGIELAVGQTPQARVEFEQRLADGTIRRIVRKLGKGRNLYQLSNEMEQYRGFMVADIDANADTLQFTNGVELTAGDAHGDISEASLRRIQIREAIKAHFDKEAALHHQGIKVLTLFFIDEVAKYRDYGAPQDQGEYARVFEEEYKEYLKEVLAAGESDYTRYLKGIAPDATHRGYFSIDRKTKRMVDPELGKKAVEADDADAYDLILRDKERLLSLQEPVRFIFSHSALREGWDNPNVFVICALKHSDNTVSRRQEVGRGLRLAVNQDGDRMDRQDTVHDINVLTVVASESYKDFVTALQKDIGDSLSARPRVADQAYFTGKVLQTPTGPAVVSGEQAADIEYYLIQNGYIDRKRAITDKYHHDRASGSLAPLPPELQALAAQVFELVDSVFSDSRFLQPENGRSAKKLLPNANIEKPEFIALWERIRLRAVYKVHFDPAELVSRAVDALDKELQVAPLLYTVQQGEQSALATYDGIKSGEAFVLKASQTHSALETVGTKIPYDLVGRLAAATQLTRADIAAILRGVQDATFAQFKTNPEHFLAEAARLIKEQKAAVVIKHLRYEVIDDSLDLDIFSAGQTSRDLSQAAATPQSHIYDYALTDSGTERDFVKELDTSANVVVYAKLPRGYSIPTPVGDYNPDWAIVLRAADGRQVYAVIETKGSMSATALNEIEKTKIACARRFFEELGGQGAGAVRYDVVNSFDKLMDLVN